MIIIRISIVRQQSKGKRLNISMSKGLFLKIYAHSRRNVRRKKLEGELYVSACDYVSLLYRQLLTAHLLS